MSEWQTAFRNETSDTGKQIRKVYVESPGLGEVICRVFGHPSDVKIQEVRARLIASAPALKQQRDDLRDACKYSHTLILRKIGQATHAVALLEAAIANCDA